jgi:hypothetical protein
MPRGIPNTKVEENEEIKQEKASMQEKQVIDDSKGEVVEVQLPEGVISEAVEDGEYKATIIRDYYGSVDVTYLNKTDPRFHYRFLRFDQKRLSIATGNLLFSGGGWQLCSREHLLRMGIPDREIGVDGLLHRGDLVLAFIPKALHEEKLKMKEEKAKAPIEGINRLLKDGDSSVGGEGMHPSMKGIQTASKLGMTS